MKSTLKPKAKSAKKPTPSQKTKGITGAKVVSFTSRMICFHKDFYSIGFDKAKVEKGIEDNREMRVADPERNWNPGMKVVKNNYYKNVGMTRAEMIAYNKDVMEYPVIPSKR